jgi:hypothetical protein
VTAGARADFVAPRSGNVVLWVHDVREFEAGDCPEESRDVQSPKAGQVP